MRRRQTRPGSQRPADDGVRDTAHGTGAGPSGTAPSTVPSGRAPDAPRGARRSRRVALAVAASAVAAVAAGAGVAAATGAPTGGDVGGLALGGRDRAGAVSAVRDAASGGPSVLTVRPADGSAVQVPLAGLGITVDAAASVDRARPSGRPGSGLRERLTGRGGRSVEPVLAVDAGALERAAETTAAALTTPETHATLVVAGATAATVPPAPGRSTSATEVKRAVLAAFRRLPVAALVEVGSSPVPAHSTREDPVDLAAQAQGFLDRTLELRAANETVRVAGQELGPAMAFVPDGDAAGHGLRLELRQEQAGPVADRAAAGLSRAPVPPVVTAPAPAPALTTQGDATWRPLPAAVTVTSPGAPGQAVSGADVLTALRQALEDDSASGTVPARPDPGPGAGPTPDSLIGTFTTRYACCQPRVTNIQLIARTVDGTLVGPGEEFSLNGLVGRRTREKGYVDAPFILDGELSSDVGGGVSQFATTMYNAAFFAGLPLLSHQAHSFYISRYPPGREATVNYPSIDLRWRNDTGSVVLVRTSTDATSLTVALYGNDGGRVVSATTGPRTPLPGGGFRITVTRRVEPPGGAPREDRTTTTYDKAPEGE